MRNKKFDWLTALISFIAAAAVFAVCLIILYNNRSMGVLFNVIGTAVTVTLPVIVSALILRLFPKRGNGVKVIFPKLLTASGSILLLILFLVSGIGQLLYSLSLNTYEEHIRDDVETRTTEHGENSDIVLLLDASGSMNSSLVNTRIQQSYYLVSRNACDVFIDSIAEECRMSGSAFADFDKLEDLKQMDADGKKDLKAKIKDTSVGGGTNLESALLHSYECLTKDSNPDRKKAVVLFSDGSDGIGFLGSGFFNDFKAENIDVYLVRPKPSYDVANSVLLSYATDIQIDFEALEREGVTADEAIKELADKLNETVIKEDKQEIVTPVYETRREIVFRDVLMLYDTEPHTVPGMIISAVCFILFAGLIQAIHFRKVSVSSLAFSGILGLVALGVTIAGGALSVIVLPAIFTPLFLYTLYIQTESR